MGNDGIKGRVSSFLKQFDLREITLESLYDVIRKQGYTIVEFNQISNNENVTALLSALGLQELSRRAKGVHLCGFQAPPCVYTRSSLGLREVDGDSS